MSEEQITIPLKKYKQMHDAAEAMSKNFQDASGRQVEIINRLQQQLQELSGYKLLASVLMDRMSRADSVEPGDPFSVIITEKEMQETNPGTWVGRMNPETNEFEIRLVEPTEEDTNESGDSNARD